MSAGDQLSWVSQVVTMTKMVWDNVSWVLCPTPQKCDEVWMLNSIDTDEGWLMTTTMQRNHAETNILWLGTGIGTPDLPAAAVKWYLLTHVQSCECWWTTQSSPSTNLFAVASSLVVFAAVVATAWLMALRETSTTSFSVIFFATSPSAAEVLLGADDCDVAAVCAWLICGSTRWNAAAWLLMMSLSRSSSTSRNSSSSGFLSDITAAAEVSAKSVFSRSSPTTLTVTDSSSVRSVMSWTSSVLSLISSAVCQASMLLMSAVKFTW